MGKVLILSCFQDDFSVCYIQLAFASGLYIGKEKMVWIAK